MSENSYDLVVIGGGPAGLAAATVAAGAGLRTALLDENSAPGGQIYRAIGKNSRQGGPLSDLLGPDYRAGAAIVEAFAASGADYFANTAVWDLSPDGSVALVADEGSRLLRAKRVIIAGGAMERPMPMPGWTLPGVMTAGAAQTLLKAAGQVPDGPVVIAGSGPLIFLVARQMVAAGVEVRALLETTPKQNLYLAMPLLPAALGGAAALWKGWRWIRELRRQGVPMEQGVRSLACLGEGRLSAVSYVCSGGKRQEIECSVLLAHQGVIPNHQLAALADCEQFWDEEQLCWHTGVDEWGASSQESIAVAGDCAGIGGAEPAFLKGRLAGLDAAFRLGAITQAQRDEAALSARRAIRRQKGLRRFLDRLYRPAPWLLAPEDDAVTVCRCEEVSAGELRRAAALGCRGPNQAKSFTRAGMGPCQGRLCGQTVSALIAKQTGLSMAEVGSLKVRPPIKPVTVGHLADLDLTDREDGENR